MTDESYDEDKERKNTMKRVLFRLRLSWWRLRHKVYFYEVPIPPPVFPSGGDDTANIQHVLNEAARTPDWFRTIQEDYQRKWYRFFLKKPVLQATAHFQSGTYLIARPLLLGSNLEMRGSGRE